MGGDFFGSAPLWVVLLLTLAALCAAAGIGMVLSSRRGRPGGRRTRRLPAFGNAGLAGPAHRLHLFDELARYDKRRETVVVEANVIGTAWLRAGLIDGSGDGRENTHSRKLVPFSASPR